MPTYTGQSNLAVKKTQVRSFYTDIIDDSDSPVSSNYIWDVSNNKGYNNTNYRYFAPGFGGALAWFKWDYINVLPSEYDIYITWTSNENRTMAAKYEVLDGNSVISTYYINQKSSPVGPIYGGVSFQKLGNIKLVGVNLSIKVYGQEIGYGYVVADAVMITRSNMSIKPVYAGMGGLLKHPNLKTTLSNILPVYVGSSRSTISHARIDGRSSGILPVYSGGILLSKHPTIYGDVRRYVPVYNGQMAVSLPTNFDGNFGSLDEGWRGYGELGINRVEIVAGGMNFLPVFAGSARLAIRQILLSDGVNILDGFIHDGTLYIMDKVITTRYMKIAVEQNLGIVTRANFDRYIHENILQVRYIAED